MHEGMRAQHLRLEVRALDVKLRLLTNQQTQRLQQRAGAKTVRFGQARTDARRALRQRRQPAAGPLWQGFQQGQQFVLQHAGHQPLRTVLRHLVQDKQRNRNAQAVLGIARLVQVGRGTVHAAQAQGFWKRLGGDARGLMAHQFVAAQEQQLGLQARRFAIPGLELSAAANLGRNLLIVEAENQFIVDQHILASGLVLQLLHLGNQAAIGGEKRQGSLPGRRRLGANQGFADHQFPCRHRVQPGVTDTTPLVHKKAVERGAFQRHHLGRLPLPVRIEQLFF